MVLLESICFYENQKAVFPLDTLKLYFHLGYLTLPSKVKQQLKDAFEGDVSPFSFQLGWGIELEFAKTKSKLRGVSKLITTAYQPIQDQFHFIPNFSWFNGVRMPNELEVAMGIHVASRNVTPNTSTIISLIALMIGYRFKAGNLYFPITFSTFFSKKSTPSLSLLFGIQL